MKFIMVLILLVVLSLHSYDLRFTLHHSCQYSTLEAQMVSDSVKTDFTHCGSHCTIDISSWVFLSGQPKILNNQKCRAWLSAGQLINFKPYFER